MHQTTMKRIAGELGVSITTVSKVLNNHADISDATKSRVLAKVEELGYQRNAVARSLTLRRTHTLGIVIPDLMHSFFVEIVAGLEATASARGYGLLLCSSGEDPRKTISLEMLRTAGRRRGARSATAAGNTDLLRHRRSRHRPRDDRSRRSCERKVTRSPTTARRPTRDVAPADLGRRAIAHIGGRTSSTPSAARRLATPCRARGITAPDDWIAAAAYEATYRSMNALHARKSTRCSPRTTRRRSGAMKRLEASARAAGCRGRRRR
jgi:LacI family transcriptional regulator